MKEKPHTVWNVGGKKLKEVPTYLAAVKFCIKQWGDKVVITGLEPKKKLTRFKVQQLTKVKKVEKYEEVGTITTPA